MTTSAKSTGPSYTGDLSVRTQRRTQALEVTAAIAKCVRDSGVQSGVCYVYVPHTTAGVMISENADPDVAADIEMSFERLAPRDAGYRHAEGNSDAHFKAVLVGSSVNVFVEAGELQLGQWQGIFFCEFDGPRQRSLLVKIMPG